MCTGHKADNTIFFFYNHAMPCTFTVIINPLPAADDYCRFFSVLLVDQITVIENEICVQA